MEIIAKISKGTKMDQIYISKNRSGLETGSYVVIRPTQKKTIKPCYYNIKDIEPVKAGIAKRIFCIINKLTASQNIIITGSFIEKGFHFNDIDVIVIANNKINENYIKKTLENTLKIKIHLIVLSSKALEIGLQTDPLYIMMLSKCIVKKRFIYKKRKNINYKILDLHNLKSELLPINYDVLTGNEKYYLTRNMIAVLIFIQNKKLTRESVDKEIERLFNIKIKDIKNNMIENKSKFMKKYKSLYNKIFNKLMEGVRNSSKQK